jgi:aminoglycoside 2''-phosphotransferase
MVEKEIRYLEFIKSRFPYIDILKIDFFLNREKYSDLVVLNDEIVFQFSKHDWTLAYLENEIKANALISRYSPVTLPALERIDREAVKYSKISGEPLNRDKILSLGIADQNHIAEQLGVFLKQLHSIPVKTAKQGGLDDSPVGMTRDYWLAEYEEIQRKVFPYADEHTKSAIALLFKPLIEDEDFLSWLPALIHADLTPEHILYDDAAKKIVRITGFSQSGIGDPAYDVSFIIGFLGEAFMKRVARFYPGVDSNLIDRARFYARADRLLWAKDVADMIATRDLTNFKFLLDERDLMPVGARW